jgi:hypothetical protein
MYSTRLGWFRESYSGALTAGSVFHLFMEYIYRRKSVEVATHFVTETSSQILADLAATLEERVTSPDGFGVAAVDSIIAGCRKDLALGLMLGTVFANNFPLPPQHKVLGVEQQLEIALDEFGIHTPLRGTLDAIVAPADNRSLIHDHKTTGYSPTSRVEVAPFEVQTKLYRPLWNAFASKHGQPPAIGVVHNVIKKPTIRQKKTETFDDYVARCFDQYDMKALNDPYDPPMLQSTVTFTHPPLRDDKELLTLLRERSHWHLRQMLLENFPRCGHYIKACSDFGKPCPYAALCRVEDPAAWFDILMKEGFKKRHPETREILNESQTTK